ncbi:MAG: septal ring lytic transglycosylase RlpA family protein [Moraxellaceae bacterium]
MSKMTYTALALFLACSPMANAELVQSQPLANTTDSSSLAGSLLERSGTPSNLAVTTLPNLTNTPVNSSARLATTPINSAKATVMVKTEESVSIAVRPTREVTASRKPVVVEEDGLMDRMNVLAAQTVRRFNQSGLASWYGRQFNGRPTASGERFDMHGLTAAHRSLPLNCYIRVTNQDNGKSVVVKVNDRGPFHGNRILDLSYGAAQQIGITSRGVGNVTIERIDPPNGK